MLLRYSAWSAVLLGVRGTFKGYNYIVVRGGGLISSAINKAIDHLPFEAHVPGGYRWCGTGTNVAKRLARRDKGINPLDEACKFHDIEYSKFTLKPGPIAHGLAQWPGRF